MPLVLGYHSVVENTDSVSAPTLPGMLVSLNTFRTQLEWIGKHYRFVSLDELGALIEQGKGCRDVAAVTFDDGYHDTYEQALPLLQKMGVPAAVFVVTDLVGTDTPPPHDLIHQILVEVFAGRHAMPAAFATAIPEYSRILSPHAVARELLGRVPATTLRDMLTDLRAQGSWPAIPPELRPLNWEQLAAMQRGGFIVGSHTRTHALLTRENDETVRDELVRSRSEIEQRLGGPVRHFAYPDGRFDPRVARAVEAAGYEFAYTICEHIDPAAPQLTIPRVMLWEESCLDAFGRFSPTLLKGHANRTLPFFSRCRDDHHLDSTRKGEICTPSSARSATNRPRSAPNS